MRHNEYTETADNFCKKHSITVKFTYTGLATNTNWDDCIPRPRYRYDIKTPLGHMWGIFWDSIANKGKLLSKDPKKIAEAEPTAYDVLACLGGDSYVDDDFDEFKLKFVCGIGHIRPERMINYEHETLRSR